MSFRIGLLGLSLIIGVLGTLDLAAQDWPQWQGAERNGVWLEPNLVDKFPEQGPPVVWRTPIGSGYGGPAVSQGRVFLIDYQLRDGDPTPDPGKRNIIEGTERVVCLDAQTGKTIWEHPYECAYRISFPAGPRCTPTVDGDRVYTLGAEGRLLCLKAEDGTVIWDVDLKKRYQIEEAPIWGFAAHPLIWGDKLYTMVGGEAGALVAIDKLTGEEAWRACPDADTGYCPPSIIKAGGVEQLVAWTPTTIYGLNPVSGSVYWSFPLAPDYKMPVAMPVVENNILFASGEGASLCLKLSADQPTAEIIWQNQGFNTSHSPLTVLDGHAIGVDIGGKLRCISLSDGERKWESLEPTTGGRPSGAGGAFMARCGDRYLIAGENGVLTLARMSPGKYETISAAKILEPTQSAYGKKVLWSHPAFAQGCCFWKNDKEIVCVRLSKSANGTDK